MSVTAACNACSLCDGKIEMLEIWTMALLFLKWHNVCWNTIHELAFENNKYTKYSYNILKFFFCYLNYSKWYLWIINGEKIVNTI